MRVLAIDTATTDLVAGIVDTDTGAVAQRVLTDTRAHNEQLMPTVDALLAESPLGYAGLDAVVVGCGPGPFTGLRVGMATAQALGDALKIPVHGVCTLDAIAHAGAGEGRVLVAIDARRREFYWAVYEDGVRVEGPEVCRPADLPQQLSAPVDATVIPDHLVDKLPDDLAVLPSTDGGVRAASIAACASLDATPQPLVPLYLRRPDAKVPAAKPKSPAIPQVEL